MTSTNTTTPNPFLTDQIPWRFGEVHPISAAVANLGLATIVVLLTLKLNKWISWQRLVFGETVGLALILQHY